MRDFQTKFLIIIMSISVVVALAIAVLERNWVDVSVAIVVGVVFLAIFYQKTD